MLRGILLSIIVLLSSPHLYAQIEWNEHQIATGYDGCWGIYCIDMDGDEDIDIVSAAREDDKLTWWENNGIEHFTEHSIRDNLEGVTGVHAEDFDNDGDIDVLAVAYYENDVYLFDNDGTMNFIIHNIAWNYYKPGHPWSYDVDSDGDKDLITCSISGHILTWWENAGYPNFTRHDIDNTIDGCGHVDAYDLDEDGDTDIIASAQAFGLALGEISWYENDGNQVFQQHYVQNNYDAFWAKAYDFDLDGDMDILGCGSDPDDISWWENDGNMNFTRHIINYNVGGPQSIEAADIDLDGDLDIVSGIRYNDAIYWWENNNYVSYIRHTINNNFDYPSLIIPLDIDSDGDVDVVGGAFLGNKISWFENQLIFSPGIITGTVFDEYMNPLDSVLVRAVDTQDSIYTNTGGQYELAVTSGIYDISGWKSGYHENIAHDIWIESGDTVTLDIPLFAIQKPCTSCVRGVVTNREFAEIESVYVWIAGTGYDDYTDFFGRYSLQGLTEDTYDVSFSHTYYLDSTITDIFVPIDSNTTLDVILESNSAIAGVVVDTALQPIAGVLVNVQDLSIYAETDSLGEYFVGGIVPEIPYDISYTHTYYIEEMLQNVIVDVNDTSILDTVVMDPRHYDAFIWYGNLDLSPVMAPIGQTVLVDVYAKCAHDIGFIHLPLGTDDQYIVDYHSVTEGVLYYPLTDWDDAQFLPPNELSPGWHSQSLLGFWDIWGDPNPPLHCPEPIRIASFAFEVADDSSLIGDTVNCFMEGDSPANGGAWFDDIDGVTSYSPCQLSSPLYFVGAPTGDCEYVVGDVNGSDSYNGLDITYGVNFFKGGNDPLCPFHTCPLPPCDTFFYCGDVNGTCSYNGLDITYGVAYFKGGPDPIPCPDCPPVE
jgi:hypothetical protein